MKIAFLGNQITFGGGATSLYLMVKSLGQFNHKIYVYATQCKSAEMREHFLKYSNRVEIIDLPELKSSQTSRTGLLKFLKCLYASRKNSDYLVKKLLADDIDIIHINNSVFSYLNKHIKKKTKIKVVTHMREMIGSLKSGVLEKFIISNIQRYSDAVIAISDNEKKVLDDERIYVLANPFDFSSVEKPFDDVRSELSIDESTIVVGMMGRFTKSKGQLEFIKVLEKVIELNRENDFKFVLVGVDFNTNWKKKIKKSLGLNYYFKVINYITKKNLNEKILLVQYTPNIFAYIDMFDIVLRPSLFKDPWGRDVIESMAMEKAVIAMGESNFYLKHEKTGILVQDLDEMALAVSNLITDEQKRKSLGDNAASYVRTKCDMLEYGKKINQIYYNLMN